MLEGRKYTTYVRTLLYFVMSIVQINLTDYELTSNLLKYTCSPEERITVQGFAESSYTFMESEGQARVEILGPSGVTVSVTGGIDMSCSMHCSLGVVHVVFGSICWLLYMRCMLEAFQSC